MSLSRHFRSFTSAWSALALLCAVAFSATGCHEAPAEAATTEPELAISVKTDPAREIESPQRLRLTGSLRGAKETDLAANVNGRIVQTLVERGQTVNEGDVLAIVDVKAAQLALAEARVSVESSKTQKEIDQTYCERYEKLKASGAVTDLEYDQVTAKCRTAPLNVEAAQVRQQIAAKNVGDGKIRAPFSGIVTERYVEQGEYVQASSRVVSLAQVEELKLVFSVPEKNFPDVKIGAEVGLKVAAYDTEFVGKVSHISGAVRATRDIVVEAVVSNVEGKLLPGMFADVELVTGSEKLPSVPASATFQSNGKLNVFAVKDGRLEQRVIHSAREVGDRIPVRKGVQPGDAIVSQYKPELENGQKVK